MTNLIVDGNVHLFVSDKGYLFLSETVTENDPISKLIKLYEQPVIIVSDTTNLMEIYGNLKSLDRFELLYSDYVLNELERLGIRELASYHQLNICDFLQKRKNIIQSTRCGYIYASQLAVIEIMKEKYKVHILNCDCK